MPMNFVATQSLPGGPEPAHVGTKEVLIQRALARLRSIPGPLERYTFLASLRNRNADVFYGLVGGNMKECCPIIYTPTIGLACQNWSLIHPPPTERDDKVSSLYLSYNDLPNIGSILRDLRTKLPHDEMEISVVTDGSRVLGLGDLGVGGMGISQGKLSLYVAGGGVNPKALERLKAGAPGSPLLLRMPQTLPITLDFGTDNEKLLADPLYLGLRQRRLPDEDCEKFVEVFMKEMHATFPNMIIQFEDFHTTLAFPLLHNNREIYPCFNDDIQGTGAVILAGAIRAFRLNGVPLEDQKILFFGAGSSGVGVAETICKYFELQGMSEEEAKSKFWLVDSRGLVSHNRGDKLPEHKKYLARSEPDAPKLRTLQEVVDHVKPTALMGLSTVGGMFNKDILKSMASYNKRPIVFALSNPVAQAECTFEEAIENTDGRVLFASGSPFDPVEYKGKRYEPGQGNNMYVFPGIGLGAIGARVSKIPEELIHAAAQGLADSLTPDENARNLLYPDIERIREVSMALAVAVVLKAQELGVARNEELKGASRSEIEHWVQRRMYHPLLQAEESQALKK
ncbi:putative Malate dehydrogenase (oxaloacetate-decarboxylating) (NADP(+)) [Rhodotorula taiwanensis]|uniref:Malic enzyme n=1 Tax=Rhodotorula taiwanensis TaxID=741276 RepID=A0A2S5BHG9_9BASI|nr:putative Malate dehydrogenase (oxaloacetate-decarboxylating) (NADP(+)) [Rhodotorula taiwanensis]